ncbi:MULTISPECIES: tRNA-(ms[2]io[6]A)-hydroxylase [Dyadobacter]|jgi:tRNA-(ms[2]io[6]A)-hydroxylase|uniref:tRNA-(Ms[2]io[6]A)-hydroxylase n=1 Tax=Dyadobacter chenhuakuii TaxID=2909339 RepID=A0A9X1TRH0_9BACT|nr:MULTISPECIES: tRNA-(ms[2]io[6]A)-hydroxylase [Dyadobacter]MCE7072148.1 tRNA-(ms[2]io[6]A)-hydroxylase [Dyadobacter sp. CY327]MCF2497949.1 tRNA-(ms[2]io[6]A)-hydroxylase [Dyadobacter chenhuakuii]MCF2519047.1 tRNA-(ms[2]io[6]A)-hydroxylase [Dyadobacter sp. CY351]
MAASLTTLGLELPTDPRWTDIAAMQLDEILIDHAYCEQKAASTCISIIVHYPERTELVETLTPIVAEEWGHFQRVLKELKKRNIPLGRQRKDEYVGQLMKLVRNKGDYEGAMLDRLLISGLIEARSCERFKLLSESLEDESLQKFYRELMISEAGHYRTFIELAEKYLPVEEVRARWKELLHQEAEIMRSITPRGDRIH